LTRVRLARSFRNRTPATFRERSCNRSSCSTCMIDRTSVEAIQKLEQPMGRRAHWCSSDLPLLQTQETTLLSGSPLRGFVQSRRMTRILSNHGSRTDPEYRTQCTYQTCRI
jgi:hypothetical protein